MCMSHRDNRDKMYPSIYLFVGRVLTCDQTLAPDDTNYRLAEVGWEGGKAGIAG
jgi:hypothetical protein